MENLFIFSINTLLIMAIWFFCFKPAVKSRKKTELNLLEIEIEKYFSLNSKTTQNKEMKNKLLAVVSGTERALDQVSLSAYIAWTMEVEKNADLSAALDREITSKFYTKDTELSDFISKIRNDSSMIGISYMIQSSFFLLVLGTLISTYIFVKEIFKKGALTFNDIRPKMTSNAEKIFKPDFIEQKSFFSMKLC